MKVLIAGVGNMGRTYAESLLSTHLIAPNDLLLLNRSPMAVMDKNEVPQTNVLPHCTDAIEKADIIMVAVKPQDFNTLAESLRPYIKPHHIVLSIMAGTTLQTLSQQLGTEKVVRCMPNLPAQIGMGVSVFTAMPAVDKKELFIVHNLLNSTGKAMYVETEDLIDAATAVSGSGPAYVFYIMEAMIAEALHLGFNRAQAELLAHQTLMGSVHLYSRHNLSCTEWIQKVASKGGTTEAALRTFDEHHTAEGIKKGINSAYKRAKELGR
jgi:pyrroline-5-carboxylate reductase